MKENKFTVFLIIGFVFSATLSTTSFAHSDDEENPCAHYEDEDDIATCRLNKGLDTRSTPTPTSVPAPAPTPVPVSRQTQLPSPVAMPAPSPIVMPAPSPVAVLPAGDDSDEAPSVVPRAKPDNLVDNNDDDSVPVPRPRPDNLPQASGGYPELDVQLEPRLQAGVRPQVGRALYNGRSNEAETPCITVTEQMKRNGTLVAGGNLPACAQEPPRVERVSSDVDILIVTDLESDYQAQSIIAAFKSIPPFKCLPLKFQVAKLTRSQLNCNPIIENGNMVKCSNSGRQKIRDLKNHYDARAEIAVIQLNTSVETTSESQFPVGAQVAANYTYKGIRQSFIGHQHTAEAAVHEFLHTVGFYDDYEYVTQNNPKSGTIMNSVFTGNVPKAWWPSISNFFGYDAPTECAWPSSAP